MAVLLDRYVYQNALIWHVLLNCVIVFGDLENELAYYKNRCQVY
jgi:hypothetical protein